MKDNPRKDGGDTFIFYHRIPRQNKKLIFDFIWGIYLLSYISLNPIFITFIVLKRVNKSKDTAYSAIIARKILRAFDLIHL